MVASRTWQVVQNLDKFSIWLIIDFVTWHCDIVCADKHLEYMCCVKKELDAVVWRDFFFFWQFFNLAESRYAIKNNWEDCRLRLGTLLYGTFRMTWASCEFPVIFNGCELARIFGYLLVSQTFCVSISHLFLIPLISFFASYFFKLLAFIDTLFQKELFSSYGLVEVF